MKEKQVELSQVVDELANIIKEQAFTIALLRASQAKPAEAKPKEGDK